MGNDRRRPCAGGWGTEGWTSTYTKMRLVRRGPLCRNECEDKARGLGGRYGFKRVLRPRGEGIPGAQKQKQERRQGRLWPEPRGDGQGWHAADSRRDELEECFRESGRPNRSPQRVSTDSRICECDLFGKGFFSRLSKYLSLREES